MMTPRTLTIAKIASASTTFLAAAATIVNPTDTSVMAVLGSVYVFGACVALESFDEPQGQRSNTQSTPKP